MARFQLAAGAERYMRKDAGRYIYLQEADGPVEVEINGHRHLLKRGKGVNVPDGFFQVTYTNLHGAPQWVTFDIGPHIFIDNELAGSVDIGQWNAGPLPVNLSAGTAPSNALIVAPVSAAVRRFSATKSGSLNNARVFGLMARLGAGFAGHAVKVTDIIVSAEGAPLWLSVKTWGVGTAQKNSDGYWQESEVSRRVHQVGDPAPASDPEFLGSATAGGETAGTLFANESIFSVCGMSGGVGMQHFSGLDFTLDDATYLQLGLRNASGSARNVAITVLGEIYDA